MYQVRTRKKQIFLVESCANNIVNIQRRPPHDNHYYFFTSVFYSTHNRGVAPLRNILPVMPNFPATKNAKSRKRLTGPLPVSKAPTNLEAFMIASVGGLLVVEYDCNASFTFAGFLRSAPQVDKHFAKTYASCIA